MVILKTGWSFTFKIAKRLAGKIFFAQAKVQQSAVFSIITIKFAEQLMSYHQCFAYQHR